MTGSIKNLLKNFLFKVHLYTEIKKEEKIFTVAISNWINNRDEICFKEKGKNKKNLAISLTN